MTLDRRRQSLLSSVGGAVAQSVPSFISTDRSPRDRTAVRWVHLSTATGARQSQPQQHGEVSGSKLIRRRHGFGPLRLGQPRSGPRCIEGYSWQCPCALGCGNNSCLWNSIGFIIRTVINAIRIHFDERRRQLSLSFNI